MSYRRREDALQVRRRIEELLRKGVEPVVIKQRLQCDIGIVYEVARRLREEATNGTR